jgi:MoxR-like ATPase
VLSKRDLQVLLDDVKKEFSIKTSYSSTGPGYLDPWLLMQKRKNIWQHIEPVQAAPSRKIIFCEPFAGLVAAQPFTIAFIAALIEHYEVYLWPGAKKPMQAVRPLASPEECWEMLPHAVAATQAEVDDSLAYQGLNSAQFIVIDHHAYGAIIDRWHEKFLNHEHFKLLETKKLQKHDRFTLNLCQTLFPTITEIAKHVVTDEIKTIISYPISKSEIEILMRLFPKLEALVIKYASATWVSKTLNTNYGLHVELRKFRADGHYILPSTLDIDSLSLSFFKYGKLKSFSAESGARVNKLKLSYQGRTFHDNINVNLTHLDMLTDLTFDHCRVEQLSVGPNNQITRLFVNQSRISPFQFSRLPALKHLKIHESTSGFLQIGQSNALLDALARMGIELREMVPQLETIELISSPDKLDHPTCNYHIDLSRDEALREVTAVQGWDITYPAHEFIANEAAHLPTNQWVLARPRFEACSMTNVYTDIEESRDKNLKFMRDARGMARGTSLLELGDHPEMESASYNYTMPNARDIQASHVKLKEFKVFDGELHPSLLFDFSGKINLQKVNITAPHSENTTVNLAGCHQLISLSVHVSIHPLSLLNLRDCRNLRTIYIRSINADILKQMALFELPEHCDIYIYKDTPPDLWSNRIKNAATACWNRLPSLPDCCPNCGNSRGNAESDNGSSCGCSKPAAIITFSILGTALAGMAIYLVYCLISGMRPFAGGGNEPTQPPIASNHTTLPAPPENPGITETAKILMGAGAGALLLLLCAGVLVYRFREHLRERLQRTRPEKYDASIYGAATVDGETMLFERDIHFNRRFNFNFYTGRQIDFNHVRLHMQNSLKWRDRKLYFYTDLSGMRMVRVEDQLLDDHTRVRVRELMSEVRESQDEALAYISGELEPGEMYPLPTLESIESEQDLLGVYSEQAGLVNFYYVPSAQQLYFGLKDRSEKAIPVTVTIFYHLRRNLNYLNIPYIQNSQNVEHVADDAAVQVQDVSELLPPEVLAYAWKRLANVPELRFMVSRQLSIPQKLNRLIDYFRSASTDELHPNPPNHIKLLFEIIAQNKGVCRHCSMGFFTMARLLGVPVVINMNRGYRQIGHRFCAIPFVTANGIRYQRVDLTLPDHSPELSEDDLNLFKEILDQLGDQPSAPEIVVMEDDSERMRATYQDYYNRFQTAVSVAQLRSIRPILERRQGPFAPLLELSNTQAPLAVNDEIVRQLKRCHINTLTHHVYIHTPEDFLTFLTPDTIVNGRCETIKEGPLVKMLMDTQHLCVLVINWSNFTAAQIASFQSVIDASPLLTVGDISIKLADNVIVIGLIRDATAAGKAFVSRSKRWQLDDSFFSDTYFDLQPQFNNEVVAIDLHHRPAWREELFGEIVYQGKSTLLKAGALNHAIARGCPLKIYNPPEDEALTQCIHQVNGEHKLLHNGHVIEIPIGVEILTAEKENALAADNIQLECESETSDSTKQRIYISINNLHELFKLLSIDKDRMADTFVGGLLKKYEPSAHILYLIGDVPQPYWQALVAYIQEHHRHTAFHVMLAYGARIQGVREEVPAKAIVNTPFSTQPWLVKNVIVSNDPDYITQQAAGELSGSMIIHITADTRFSDIIASIVHDDEHHTGFIYTEHSVLTALKGSQTVILSGEMSLTLYYQLQSLLSRDPHIQLNGERQAVSGRLMAVVPACMKEVLPGLTSECSLAAEDYLPLVSTLPSFNETHFQQILAFYQRLCKLPHRGPGRPPMPEINYQRLKMLLNALADPIPMHAHNPIKGLINFHYPRHSEDQAYINVMAKYFFTARDNTPTRFRKMRRLVREYDIQTTPSLKKHLWKILNCYHGTELSQLLEDDLANIDHESKFPMVNIRLLNKLLETCRRVAAMPEEVEQPKPMRVEKQLAMLNTASKNPNTPVIFLKGEPGIGKTYTVRKLIGQYYEGEQGLLDYLMAKDKGERIVFLWDEGNTNKPGAMDFLIKALSSPDRRGNYKDLFFQLTPMHQLYITGNPENFPGRYFHQAILDYAVVIYFDLPDDAFLLQLTAKILPSHLQPYADTILFAYHLIKKFNPFFVTSIRDVENLTHRFRFLAQDIATSDNEAIRFALLNACTTEFAGSIRETQDRADFVSSLQKQIGVKPVQTDSRLIMVTNTVSIPSQKAYIMQAIEQNLEIRLAALMQLALNNAQQGPASFTLFNDKGKEELDAPCISLKQADILEGEPGIGKSTLLRAIVDKYKQSLPLRRAALLAKPMTRDNLIMLSVIEAEIKRPVHEISVGSADCAVTLRCAFHEESLTIGDESNVDPKIEQQLIQCVSGVDENMLPVQRLGFRFLGSQNSSAHAGRMDASHAVRNRSHFIYMDNFVRQEYELYAEAAKIPYPKQFVRAYMEICRIYPAANTRTFHQVLKMVISGPAQRIMPRQPTLFAGDMEAVVMQDDEFYLSNEDTPLLTFGRY